MTAEVKKSTKTGEYTMHVKIDDKMFWNGIRGVAQQNQNSAEALTMMTFVSFFVLIAANVAFAALGWRVAEVIALGLMIGAVLLVALLQWYVFRQMKIKHKAIRKLDSIEEKELEEKLAKETVVVDEDGKLVEISVKELVTYSTRVALDAYKKELADMQKKLDSKDGQPKKNKRK